MLFVKTLSRPCSPKGRKYYGTKVSISALLQRVNLGKGATVGAFRMPKMEGKRFLGVLFKITKMCYNSLIHPIGHIRIWTPEHTHPRTIDACKTCIKEDKYCGTSKCLLTIIDTVKISRKVFKYLNLDLCQKLQSKH